MEGAHKSFISSTYWTESIGPAAALAVLKKMQRIDVPEHVERIGSAVMKHWKNSAEKYRLPVVVEDAYPCFANFHFDHELAEELRTLYTQLMLKRGFLASTMIYCTLAHTDEIVSRYGAAIDQVFDEIAQAISSGDVEKRLKGPVAHKSFQRLL